MYQGTSFNSRRKRNNIDAGLQPTKDGSSDFDPDLALFQQLSRR